MSAAIVDNHHYRLISLLRVQPEMASHTAPHALHMGLLATALQCMMHQPKTTCSLQSITKSKALPTGKLQIVDHPFSDILNVTCIKC